MASAFRVGSFNVENLFSRAKVLNLSNPENVNNKLARIDRLNTLINKPTPFTSKQKLDIVALYKELSDYVAIRENRGSKLFNRSKTKVTATSGKDWDGELEFKRERFSKLTRENTAKVIRTIKADIACVIEAEDRPTLKSFDTDLLRSHFKYEMLLDGNDNRGIDVGIYSRFPLGGIWTHMFDRSGNSATFSRDCPEYEVLLPNGNSLFLLCNHLKSKGYDTNGTADQRRTKQATAIAKILEEYDLSKDWVVVAGDLNDTPDSAPLRPLLSVPNMFDVLDLHFGKQPALRWTYEYKGAFDQIDYILVSKPLKERLMDAGVERRGIYGLHRLTSKTNGGIPVEREFASVTEPTNAASDHGAVWAEFSL